MKRKRLEKTNRKRKQPTKYKYEEKQSWEVTNLKISSKRTTLGRNNLNKNKQLKKTRKLEKGNSEREQLKKDRSANNKN